MGVLLVVTVSCESRIPSRSRLEQICGIRLPDDFNVLKDEYRDVGADYCIAYEVKFGSAAISFLKQKITASPNYQGVSVPGGHARIWYKTDRGYSFRHNNGRLDYTIDFDTASGKLIYSECN